MSISLASMPSSRRDVEARLWKKASFITAEKTLWGGWKTKKSIGFDSGWGFVSWWREWVPGSGNPIKGRAAAQAGTRSSYPGTHQTITVSPKTSSISMSVPADWRACDFCVPAGQRWQTCHWLKSRNTHQNTPAPGRQWGMTAGSHLTCSNFFWSLSHQSLQHEAMMEQQEPQEKISNPSTKHQGTCECCWGWLGHNSCPPHKCHKREELGEENANKTSRPWCYISVWLQKDYTDSEGEETAMPQLHNSSLQSPPLSKPPPTQTHPICKQMKTKLRLSND